MKQLLRELRELCSEFKASVDRQEINTQILNFLPRFYVHKETFKDVSELFRQEGLDELQTRAENIYYGYRASLLRDRLKNLSKVEAQKQWDALKEELETVRYQKIFHHYMNINLLLNQCGNDEETVRISTDDLETLKYVLSINSWDHKLFAYMHKVKAIDKYNSNSTAAAVVIISNNNAQKILPGLKALFSQRTTKSDYKIVLVSNNVCNRTPEVLDLLDTFVLMNTNSGAYLARNVGSIFANAEVLIFMDDDGIPDRDFVKHHKQLHESDIIGARGVCLPAYNGIMPDTYWIGFKERPCPTDLEGNCSFKRKPFFACGGWGDYIYFGHGGYEINHRMLKNGSTPEQKIYSPKPIIFHDYVTSGKDLRNKKLAQHASWQVLKFSYTDFHEILSNWPLLNTSGYRSEATKIP